MTLCRRLSVRGEREERQEVEGEERLSKLSRKKCSYVLEGCWQYTRAEAKFLRRRKKKKVRGTGTGIYLFTYDILIVPNFDSNSKYRQNPVLRVKTMRTDETLTITTNDRDSHRPAETQKSRFTVRSAPRYERSTSVYRPTGPLSHHRTIGARALNELPEQHIGARSAPPHHRSRSP